MLIGLVSYLRQLTAEGPGGSHDQLSSVFAENSARSGNDVPSTAKSMLLPPCTAMDVLDRRLAYATHRSGHTRVFTTLLAG
jgi:hypothetical protein